MYKLIGGRTYPFREGIRKYDDKYLKTWTTNKTKSSQTIFTLLLVVTITIINALI